MKKDIIKLEEEFFELYEKRYGKKDDKKYVEKSRYEILRLKEGDWIYCDYFKEANKVKRIKNDYIEFLFAETNGIKSGVLSFVENRQNNKTHRYATSKEIETRLIKEIKNLKNYLKWNGVDKSSAEKLLNLVDKETAIKIIKTIILPTVDEPDICFWEDVILHIND